jgi:hypothetical protein
LQTAIGNFKNQKDSVMQTNLDKTQGNKSQSVANAVAQKYSGGESNFQFVDNSPEAIGQRKLQEMANNSPQVSQLRAFQKMADNYSAQQRQPIQRKVNSTSPGGLIFSTSEFGDSSNTLMSAIVAQRKLDFSFSGGRITRCVFTKRPGWTTEVRHAMPSLTGFDRGHLIPWMAVRLEIEFDMTGLTLADAYDYLNDKGHTPDTKTWADVEKAIKAYGKAENSELDNLEYEDSSDNRSNGAKLPTAAELWQCAHEINDWEWDPPYEFNGVTITTKAQAKTECLEVGVPDKSLWPEARKRFGKGSNCVIQ